MLSVYAIDTRRTPSHWSPITSSGYQHGRGRCSLRPWQSDCAHCWMAWVSPPLHVALYPPSDTERLPIARSAIGRPRALRCQGAPSDCWRWRVPAPPAVCPAGTAPPPPRSGGGGAAAPPHGAPAQAEARSTRLKFGVAGDLTCGMERFILCTGGPHQDRRCARVTRHASTAGHLAGWTPARAPLACGRCPACAFLNSQLLDLTRPSSLSLPPSLLPPAGARRINRCAPPSTMAR
jgi:hypothetical protein